MKLEEAIEFLQKRIDLIKQKPIVYARSKYYGILRSVGTCN